MKKSPLLLLILCQALLCRSQSGLHISSSTTLSIKAYTTLAVDGLVLTPSSNYIVTGSNSVSREATLQHSSVTPAINRSFQWTASLPAYTGSIGFYYEDAELNGLAEAELTLNIHDGTQWKAYPGGVSRNGVTNIVTTPVSGLIINELALAAEPHPLPLQWGRIAASRKEAIAIVNWETHNEVQTAFFEVERSVDGEHWSRIGKAVRAQNQPGTHHYQFMDSTVTNQKTFYRIRQVDINEDARYSSITWVPALQLAAAVSIYPNPASQQLTVRSTGLPLQTIQLFDANGKLLKTETISNSFLHTLPLTTLPSGVYMVQAQLSDGSTIYLSFIKN